MHHATINAGGVVAPYRADRDVLNEAITGISKI